MKTLLIYERLVGLNRERHLKLKLKSSEQGHAFARATNSVLLAASELPQACPDYPCVFIEAADGHALAALVGLRDQENLFVDAQNEWQAGSYMPAFIRRYPFVLADSGVADEFTVCIDESYPGLSEGGEEGEALFDADGSDSAWLSHAKQFLLGFRAEMESSREFAQAMDELGLLVERVIEFSQDGQTRSLSGFKMIDEQKLLALPPDQVQALHQKGWLGLIYAHLISLAQVPRLAQRLEQAQVAQQQQPAPQPQAQAQKDSPPQPAQAVPLH